MLDSQKIFRFVALKRKELQLTQAEIAEKLKVSYQTVSRWKNSTIPNMEILMELVRLLNVPVDTLFNGGDRITYEHTNVDFVHFAELRKKTAAQLTAHDPRILNKPAMPTVLYNFYFPGIPSAGHEPELVRL